MAELNFDIDFENPEVKKSFERVVHVQNTFIRELSDQDKDLERERKSYDSYFADSWEDEIKRSRESKGLPVSDVARFSSIVDTISGAERQDRTDISIFPFEKDDQLTADVGNLYLKYRNRKEYQWHEDSLAFINAIISRRSHYEYVLKNNPRDGSLETHRILRPSSEVLVQKPFRDITAKDSRGTIHAQWVYLDDLKAQFKGKLPVELLDLGVPEIKPQKEITHLLDAYDFPDKKESGIFFRKSGRQMVRVIRWWRKHQKRIYRVLNFSPNTFNEILIATETSRKKALSAAIAFLDEKPELAINIVQNNNLFADGELITEPTSRNIEIIASEMIEEDTRDSYALHKVSGRVELEYVEDWGDFQPWTHLFCYFADGKAGGLHERVKDLIQEINFIHAKLMQRLGTMGKMPLGIETDATEMSEDAVKENFQDGGVIWLTPDAVRKAKIKEFDDKTLNSIPSYIGLEESLNNTMKELTGANDPLQGRAPGANTAGIAIELLQRKGSALIAPIQDNFKRFKMENARMEINMLLRAHSLRPMWTSMKIARIVGGTLTDDASPLAKQLDAVDQTTKEGDDTGIVTFINNTLKKMSGMEYDFTIDEFIHSPTIRMTTFQLLSNIARVIGFPLDPSVIIENTELPQKQKDKLVAFLTAAAGQQQVAARQASGGLNENGSLPNAENLT